MVNSMKTWNVSLVLGTALALVGCGSSSNTPDSGMTDEQYKAAVVQNMHDSMQADLTAMLQAAKDLQAAAPTHAWDQNDPAWATMNDAWIRARHAYEHVEGATAPIFPDIDVSIDGRVEDFGPAGNGLLTANSDMFGKAGMTGLHAVERILYTSSTPASVVTYENGLGYAPAQAYPTTDQQAQEFKTQLCQQIVDDAQALLDGWTPAHIDIGSAFQGLVALMNEQQEKVKKAGLHTEESRYAQRTMDDLRYNLEGTQKIYGVFQPWLLSKTGGAHPGSETNAELTAAFATLNTLYNSPDYAGLAFPPAPADWSDENPSQADLDTPFGKLYTAVVGAVDPTTDGSVVFEMNEAATTLGLPTFQG